MRYEAPDGIPNLRLPGDTRIEVVRRFYERAPFPDYHHAGSLSWLRARAERSEFARLIDRGNSRQCSCRRDWCGTGQMSLYLARADRVVIGADLTRASLMQPPQRPDVSDSIRYSSSKPTCTIQACGRVLSMWSTRPRFAPTPDPSAAFARIVRLARPGG